MKSLGAKETFLAVSGANPHRVGRRLVAKIISPKGVLLMIQKNQLSEPKYLIRRLRGVFVTHLPNLTGSIVSKRKGGSQIG